MPALSKLLIVSTAVTLLMPGLAVARQGSDDAFAESSPTVSATPKASESPEDHSGSGRTPRLGDAVAKVKIEGSDFCSKFDIATSTVSSETTGRFAKLTTDFSERKQKVDSDFDKATTETTKNRAEIDAKLAAKLADMEAKAATDEQKAAATAYKTSVLAAVAARRAAVDAANTAFKTGIKSALTARQTQLTAAATAYKTAVAAALTKAKTSCAAGTSASTVRATLKSDINAARTKLEAARQLALKDNTKIEELKATRKAALLKANADFKVAIKVALDKLKAALGTESPDPSVSPKASKSPEASESPEASPKA